jgi:hypothetical protein
MTNRQTFPEYSRVAAMRFGGSTVPDFYNSRPLKPLSSLVCMKANQEFTESNESITFSNLQLCGAQTASEKQTRFRKLSDRGSSSE